MSILHNLFFFIIALGLLVTFHEFGHYWVARKAGVRVLRFSVGFGKPLYRWVRNVEGHDIEYVIAAIPLGGYVKMLDEREGQVSAADRPRAFNRQSLAKRTAIVAAGPIFNFILAIALYAMVFNIGTVAERALIDVPAVGTIAADSGFELEDEIVGVQADEVRSWSEFRLAVIEHGLDGGVLDVEVIDRDGHRVVRSLDLADSKLLKDEGDVIRQIGFTRWSPDLPAVIGGVVEESPASHAGIQDGDRVLAIDGVSIGDWKQLVEMVRPQPATVLNFAIEREGVPLEVEIITGSRGEGDERRGFIGAYQHVPDEIKDRLQVELEYGVIDSLSRATERTWDMSVLTLKVLGKMLIGDASLNNISGPITIATYAGVTAQIGLTTYLGFLAIISLSLGVINLLPVPMLDGGHLMYYLIEWIKGSPVSEAFELRGQQIGIVILAMLMSLALFNDFQRLLQ